LIERLLRNETLYELVQEFTGTRRSEAHIRQILGPLPANAVILDAGGGTGIMARLFDGREGYCCMDLELSRVKVARRRGARGLVGDVTRMPVGSSTIDLAIQRAVSHHLDDSEFVAMTAETSRILKPDGRLLFLDATWSPGSLPRRFLWGIDQGSHPRTADQMRSVIEERFEIERSVSYATHHRYFLAMARPRAVRAAFS
jgi:ubiquinone/menaquinone biosynthesis C-methylase UbiE